MSFLSILGKIAKPVIGLLPGGGTLTSAMDLAGDIGSVAGGMAGGRAQGRKDEFSANLQQAQVQDKALMDRAGLDLERRSFANKAPDQKMSQIMRGNILSSLMKQPGPQGPAGLPSFNFSGMNRSMLGPETGQGSDFMAKDALQRLMAGEKFADVPMQDFSKMQPKAGFLDKLLSTVGMGGSILGALSNHEDDGEDRYAQNDINRVGRSGRG